jgi:hypothetical protein
VVCGNCWCWVCDEKLSQCIDWEAHCLCDGSSEWAVARAKLKRKKETKTKGPATDSADAVNARFQNAQNAANGGDVPMTEAERQRKEEAENARGEDEENEELFAEYEPRHFEVRAASSAAAIDGSRLR